MSFRVDLLTSKGIISLSLNPDELGPQVGVPKNQWENATLLIGAWLAVLSDSPLSGNTKRSKKCYTAFLRRLETEGLIPTIASFSELADTLCREAWGHEQGALTSDLYNEFKDTPVFREYHHWKRSGDPELFKFLLTFLRFSKKSEFDLEEFKARAFHSWLEVEERLGSLSLDGNEHIPYLRKIVQYCTAAKFSAPTLMGKHGSGAVAGAARGVIEKTSSFSMYDSLERLFSDVLPMGGASEGVMLGYTCSFIRAQSPKKKDEGRSRLMFVPKNYKTSRSICMEPTEFMFFQQHIRWEVENMISTGILGRFITIQDQGRNQQGAIYGSRTGLVDTIDLSAASDSLSLQLVEAIFQGPLLGSLLATRTPIVEVPNGELVRVHKFAPMGSALCFPVQSIVYAAVCLYAYILHASTPERVDAVLSTQASFEAWVRSNISSTFDRMSLGFESIAVYGDDIVCDTRCTLSIMSILEELGFTINFEKSFVGHHSFRESCGVYALNGADVTPFHYKGRSFEGRFTGDDFARYIGLANVAGHNGMRYLHRYLVNAILRWRPNRAKGLNPIAFSGDRECGFALFSKNPHNSHLKKRVSKDLQRDEVRSWILRPSKVVVPDVVWRDLSRGFSYDSYSYHMSSRAAVLRGENGDIFTTPRMELQGASIKWGWTPA